MNKVVTIVGPGGEVVTVFGATEGVYPCGARIFWSTHTLDESIRDRGVKCPVCERVHYRTDPGDRRPTREEIESAIRNQGRNAYTLTGGVFPLPYTCDVCGKGFDNLEKLDKIYVRLPGAVAPAIANRCVDCFERICREVEESTV